MTVELIKVNKYVDFAERVGWTAVQAAAGAALTVLTGADINWATAGKFVAITAAIAALKVIVAQSGSGSGLGAVPDPAQKATTP